MQGVDKVDGSDDDPRIRYYFFRQNACTPGASCGPGNGETLQCSLQSAPAHYQALGIPFCFLEDGFWCRPHGNDEGTPPDNFTRTAVGVYPAAGLFDDDRFGGLNQSVGGLGAGISPFILSSHVDFWKAEIALTGGDASGAAAFVAAGMTKSIDKVNDFAALDPSADTTFEPTPGYISTYITDTSALITGNDPASWNVLAEQTFIALYGGGGGDAYNFYRRTGFPTNVFPNIEPNPGTFPRTFF